VIESVTVKEASELDSAFGSVGLKVGPRTGVNKRTKDDKEWYVVRRFLKEAIAAHLFRVPFTLCKCKPPEPDFVLDNGSAFVFVEITEATAEDDQREMTALESSGRDAILLGELGGRFSGGGGEPGHVWSTDIIEAIERKTDKSIFTALGIQKHLVIYPNSNASFLIFDSDDERRAFSLLLTLIEARRAELVNITNGCLIHVLGKEHVFFDILGAVKFRNRIK
jgi:hypothetical protein